MALSAKMELSLGRMEWLDRYLDEFVYRFNGRKDDNLFYDTLKNMVNEKALPFEKQTKIA